MKIETVYFVTEHGNRLNLTLDDLAAGELNILWLNNGHFREISHEKIGNAINVLEDMSKHKGPDTGNPFISFFWDDGAYLH